MWIDRQDLLYTIRSSRRAPLLSVIAVLALSLGIGLNAGVFTLLNALFLSPPTQKDPARFIQIFPDMKACSFDASVFCIAAALLVAVSLAGMYLPALRATRVDPIKALRTE